MKKKFKIRIITLLFFLFVAVSFCVTNLDTFSAFTTSSDVGDINIKKWNVKVNGTNITYRNSFVFETLYSSQSASEGVKNGYVTPGCVFDVPVLIDASKSEFDLGYQFSIDSEDSQFEILSVSPSQTIQAGSELNVLVTIQWNGTGNVDNDISLQGKNIDVPLLIRISQSIE